MRSPDDVTSFNGTEANFGARDSRSANDDQQNYYMVDYVGTQEDGEDQSEVIDTVNDDYADSVRGEPK